MSFIDYVKKHEPVVQGYYSTQLAKHPTLSKGEILDLIYLHLESPCVLGYLGNGELSMSNPEKTGSELRYDLSVALHNIKAKKGIAISLEDQRVGKDYPEAWGY